MATIPASRRADLDRGFGRAVAFCRSTDLRTFVFWCAPVLGCLLSYGLCFYLFAQDAVFVANVKVVPLLATVRDRAGKVVNNLTKEDFVLEEDGRRRPIEYFSKQSDLALTIGLLVDTSKSQRRVLNAERRASDAFLSHVMREDRDTAFVAHFDIRVGILQGPTSSRERLSAALAGLKTPHLAGTRLYSGIRLASENLMRTQKGRKAFILLSDGVNYLDNTSIGTAIEYAQRADTIIYSIIYADHASARGTKVM
jgi:VWFA-related protein